MSRRRGIVTDYAGEELHEGDLISYASRCENRVRMADAVILEVRMETFKGRLIPFLKVQPTGMESGFTKRKVQREVEIMAEHVRLIQRDFVAGEL